jgi:hypothetical protein
MTVSSPSPQEQFFLAARCSVLGRAWRDPVLLLAAARIATQLGKHRAAQVNILSVAATPRIRPARFIVDARPIASMLRSEARAIANEGAERELIDILDGQVADLTSGAENLLGLTALIEPGRGIEWAMASSRSVIVVGDGRGELACRFGQLSDADAMGTLAFLVAPENGTATVRIDNVGPYPTDILCVWGDG